MTTHKKALALARTASRETEPGSAEDNEANTAGRILARLLLSQDLLLEAEPKQAPPDAREECGDSDLGFKGLFRDFFKTQTAEMIQRAREKNANPKKKEIAYHLIEASTERLVGVFKTRNDALRAKLKHKAATFVRVVSK